MIRQNRFLIFLVMATILVSSSVSFAAIPKFANNTDILNYINPSGSPSVREIFGFVTTNTQHVTTAPNPHLYYHHPPLFINSGGRGFCDDIASVFVHLCNAAGYRARVIILKNHIVAEVWNNESKKWEMYDPDYRVFYYKSMQGDVIASANEIHENASQITRPFSPILSINSRAYSQMIADCYLFNPRVGLRYCFDVLWFMNYKLFNVFRWY